MKDWKELGRVALPTDAQTMASVLGALVKDVPADANVRVRFHGGALWIERHQPDPDLALQ